MADSGIALVADGGNDSYDISCNYRNLFMNKLYNYHL
jgi:hypothetical protein